MSGRDAADSAELSRLQRAVYGPRSDSDVVLAQERLREIQGVATWDDPGVVVALPSAAAINAVHPGQRTLTPAQRILWAGLGALTVVILTVAGFFLGALTVPHPDRVLIPVVEANDGRLASEAVTAYREFTADQMKIGVGTLTGEGAERIRCLYVGGAQADLRSETLSGTCAPTSDYGTTWVMSGDLGTGSSLFGLGVRDSIRFIERDSGLEVWLSREPT